MPDANIATIGRYFTTHPFDDGNVYSTRTTRCVECGHIQSSVGEIPSLPPLRAEASTAYGVDAGRR